MTFKGEKIIGKPTLALIEIYIAEKGLECEPQEVFDYWNKKKWLTKKNVEVKTLESAINVFNGIRVSRVLRKSKKSVMSAQLKANSIKKNNSKKKPYSLYRDQLKSEQWKHFRNFVFNIRGRKCEICKSDKNLQIHHLEYHKNAKAWEYTCNDVIVVCEDCHKRLHGLI